MDNEILIDLKKENNDAYGKLYREHFRMVEGYVCNNSGSKSDAEDIFQDTLIVLLNKLSDEEFELSASLRTYIYAISKNLWLKRLRKHSRVTLFNDIDSIVLEREIDATIIDEITLRDKIRNYLKRITDHCSRLINDMFFKEKPIREIQSEYGYSTLHSARNQKHKCLNQLRKLHESEK